ncbi:MAG: peptidylprolyl isomerase [Bacteroidetes bacterium]|nr:peptidylprolyl isomerase [Bacteroidota bacterium]
MIIEIDKVVSMTYELKIQNEQREWDLVDSSKEGHPLVFLYGHGNLIVGFERNVQGLKAGDHYDFKVSPEEGYGVSDARQVVNLPIDTFRDHEGKLMEDILVIGTAVPMNNDEGHRLTGIIKGITSTEVIMDFNHPMADKELHFTGTIVSVRPATPDEIAHGHVHGDGGVHH